MEKESKVDTENPASKSWRNDSCTRLRILALAVAGGLILYLGLFLITMCVLGDTNGDKLSLTDLIKGEKIGRLWGNIFLLLLSLPVLLALWWFRTHDTREQIGKAEEQIGKAEQQIDASIESREASARDSQLSTGLQLIADTDVAARCIGLVQLALVRSRCQELEEKLRDQLQGQIDASTQDLVLYKEAKYTSEGEKEEKEEVVKLRRVMLENMNLRGATMTGAHLEGAHLNGVNLEGADLKGADLKHAHLKGANLTGAFLQGADLMGADLERALLAGAHLQKLGSQATNLVGADLRGANLASADLRGADLHDAHLQKSDLLLEPSLTWFDNRMSGMTRFSHRGKGANLVGAKLEGANLRGAVYDEHTIIDFDPEKKGLIKDNEEN